jgi:hypothetical protein
VANLLDFFIDDEEDESHFLGVNDMDLRFEFYIAGSPEQVWNALISPEGTKKTYYGSVIRSTFEIGSPMEYAGPGIEGKNTIHIYGKVLELQGTAGHTGSGPKG